MRSPWARATRSQRRSCRARARLRGFLSVAPRTRRPAQIQGFSLFLFFKSNRWKAQPPPAPGQRRGPRQSVATQSSSSPLELVLPQTVGPECQHFPIPRGACHRVPSGPAWSLGGARGPGTGVPPPVPKPLGRGFGRTSTGPGIRGRQPRGGLLSGRVLSQVGHRGPGRAFLIVRASPGLVSPSPVPLSPSSACV